MSTQIKKNGNWVTVAGGTRVSVGTTGNTLKQYNLLLM